MVAKLQTWWQRIKRPLEVAVIIFTLVILIVLIIVIIIGYLLKWGWTGLSQKTLWDWLQLLIIPLVLAVAALLFNRANSRTEQQIAKQRYEQDQQIALDKQREDLLQAYLDRIAELLLEKQLGTSASEAVRNVARVRTITVLTQLDARRIGYVFAFLREAGLMSTTSNDNVVSLSHADLHAVNWSQANLSDTNLSKANLSDANLSGANLSDASLVLANLSGASLIRALLRGAFLDQANLSEANLSEANLLAFANLSQANLSEANLSDAKVTEEQLKKAKSLEGATLPDRSIHP